jgi:hypothetical protein
VLVIGLLAGSLHSNMGCSPHSTRSVFLFMCCSMKTNCRVKPLILGGFITATNHVWDGELAERNIAPKMPSQAARNVVAPAWHATRFPVRIIAKLRAAIASRVPVGYEDETGFHYGVKAGD